MSLAGGLWILHKSYLDACSAANTWLPEEAYEWGGPGTEPLLIQLSPAPNAGRPGAPGALSCAQLRELAKAARHWRKAGGRAFRDWKVVFGPGCDRESSFRRIIEYGGGKVSSQRPNFVTMRIICTCWHYSREFGMFLSIKFLYDMIWCVIRPYF